MPDSDSAPAPSDAERVLREQIDRLANFIMENIPGEPSQSEGAIDTAIRLLRAPQQQDKPAGHGANHDQAEEGATSEPASPGGLSPQQPPSDVEQTHLLCDACEGWFPPTRMGKTVDGEQTCCVNCAEIDRLRAQPPSGDVGRVLEFRKVLKNAPENLAAYVYDKQSEFVGRDHKGECLGILDDAFAALRHLPAQPCVDDVEALFNDAITVFFENVTPGEYAIYRDVFSNIPNDVRQAVYHQIRSHTLDAVRVRAERDMVWCDAFGGSSSNPKQVAAIQKERRALVRAEALEEVERDLTGPWWIEAEKDGRVSVGFISDVLSHVRALAPKERSE